ncbi:hypothetical protein SALBM217S_07819 [Streptomyces griseoloalbus]
MTDTRPLALITGASSGIGLELARQFASHGYDLVVNAEDEELEAAARQLRESGTEVRAVRADLRTGQGHFLLLDALDGLTVDVAALNAGVGQGGAFVDTDLTDDQAVIDLNVTATVRLAKPLLGDGGARGRAARLHVVRRRADARLLPAALTVVPAAAWAVDRAAGLPRPRLG